MAAIYTRYNIVKMDSKFDQLSALVGLAKSDYSKFSSGTKVCATRCRQHLQSIVKTCAELRKAILDESKAMVKPKAAVDNKENVAPVEEVPPPPEPLTRSTTDIPVPETSNSKNLEVTKATPAVVKPVPRQRRPRKPASRS